MPADYFVKLLHAQGLALTSNQLEQFADYYRLLVEWNEKMNLTAITDQEQVYIKHFYDSLTLSFYIPLDSVSSLADIGSGAGFPSVPLKIVFPHLKITIVDSLNKRIQFLNHLAERLGLDNMNCVHSRAEDAARSVDYREAFDLVTARAVARLAVLNELCLPFVRTGGQFVAMKGPDAGEELEEAEFSLKQLGGKLDAEHRFELPVEQSARTMIVIRKSASTPGKYPRKAGEPLRKPLIAGFR